MRNFDQQKDYWKPCRPGTILKAVDSKLQIERRRFLIGSAMGVVVAGAGIFSAFFISNNGNRRRFGGEVSPDFATAGNRSDGSPPVAQANKRKTLTCDDIKTDLDEYLVAFRLPVDQRSERQTALLTGFDVHLKVCQKCLPMVNSALNSEAVG